MNPPGRRAGRRARALTVGARPRAQVGKEHVLHDEDVVQLVKKV